MKSEYQNLIILKLRKLRMEKKFSQKEIAELLGISNGQMGNIESPHTKNKYTLQQIYTICTELKLPIEQIFIEDEELSTGKEIINLLISKIIKYNERQ
ncbi:MAG: helix-turn-helix transcriptional regulator [Muribaculaceae bacterium]|jgi:transcriptional regulator with XRE-family HTH domain|nr:helix-turn-helix transcriptional regulator [Muribaculaceae bacterium]